MKKRTGIKKFVIIRRYSQAFFLVLFVSILTPAGEHLAGILPARFFLRSSPLIVMGISIGIRTIIGEAGIALIMLLLTMVFGRFFCGWVCPMGTVIDCAGAVKKKRKVFSDTVNSRVSSVKFYILGLLLLLSVFKVQTVVTWDPLVIMARVVSLYIVPALSVLQGTVARYLVQPERSIVIFILALGISVAVSRLWCRALCPLGALYALVSRFSLLERVDVSCSDCGTCPESCRMGAIKNEPGYVKSECVLCMDCVYNCARNDVKFTWRKTNKK